MYFKSGSWFWREEEEGFGVYLLSMRLCSTGAERCLVLQLSCRHGPAPAHAGDVLA